MNWFCMLSSRAAWIIVVMIICIMKSRKLVVDYYKTRSEKVVAGKFRELGRKRFIEHENERRNS